ncbi:glycosyltransferase [Virgibacillus salinus]|uniref:Glycosyltransferase involved in cell wall bisynthesis n=1 Tax=Virgibacillus salinus TaxID=553311 RepID=A0A1H0YI74_9BACI|nr:glycosyltransferase [Virgibacillus salinus]SDQ14862.1 Glycosyltransferase involved in cell wall bisynthesis [Virgibacillus salinus]
MKVAFLAPANSIHVIRWANAIAEKCDLTLITMHDPIEVVDSSITVIKLKYPSPWGYLLNKKDFEKKLKLVKPDIIHIHQASGHATLAVISNLNKIPTLLSVYGSDVFEFPEKTWLHKLLIYHNLKNINVIASTSHSMKDHINKLYPQLNKAIEVTPFGVNLNSFRPCNARENNSGLVVGIVKRLETTYGIDYLIKAFHNTILKLNEEQKEDISGDIKLIIVGKGSERNNLELLSRKLNIQDKVEFIGRINHDEVPKWLNKFDIYCAPSMIESFGVAVIEASACGKPVIVSNVGGLPEVVDHTVTGFVFENKNIDELSDYLYKLILDESLRNKMGENGIAKVERLYNWEENVKDMYSIYKKIISYSGENYE